MITLKSAAEILEFSTFLKNHDSREKWVSEEEDASLRVLEFID